MKISTRGRYAVRIMAELAKNYGTLLSSAELCEKQDISPKYAEKILALLKKANLIKSEKGATGGYTLSSDAKEINVAQILKATDDLPELVPCIENKTNCPRKMQCDSVGCWEKLNSLIVEYLSKLTLFDLINKNY